MTDPDDDPHWLDLMAGRTVDAADARTRKEAAWLRAALLSYRPAAPQGGPADADARIRRLLARARAAGVLAATANDAAPARRRSAWWPPALAASVAAFGVMFAVLSPHEGPDDGGTLRGAPVQTVRAADPEARRAQLLQALRAAGFDAQPFERLGRAGIDVALPVPLPPEQAAALGRLGLAAPAGPSLQIEFAKPEPGRP
ncbi:MAG: hypothetical protein QM788_04530 [Roseateles sp.]|uniref:hypothetical protein n=1 Tax=Roseateles sp. TaxID=1971397 RepID=UPI0039EAA608